MNQHERCTNLSKETTEKLIRRGYTQKDIVVYTTALRINDEIFIESKEKLDKISNPFELLMEFYMLQKRAEKEVKRYLDSVNYEMKDFDKYLGVLKELGLWSDEEEEKVGGVA